MLLSFNLVLLLRIKLLAEPEPDANGDMVEMTLMPLNHFLHCSLKSSATQLTLMVTLLKQFGKAASTKQALLNAPLCQVASGLKVKN